MDLLEIIGVAFAIGVVVLVTLGPMFMSMRLAAKREADNEAWRNSLLVKPKSYMAVVRMEEPAVYTGKCDCGAVLEGPRTRYDAIYEPCQNCGALVSVCRKSPPPGPSPACPVENESA